MFGDLVGIYSITSRETKPNSICFCPSFAFCSLVAELQSQLVDRNNRLRDLMTQNNILEEARSSALQKLEIQAATIYELRSAVEAVWEKIDTHVRCCVCITHIYSRRML